MKKLIFMGLLLIAPPIISNLSAVPKKLLTAKEIITDKLSDKLAADKDFQQLSL